ncbi:DgyrCDS10902 [Dimorphilus gyrociliatus]|uniref:DgyrCDS10902 n=1 Tax=Dimorphilus gyrociliatus TaxID=2664684 RepID=A0A7I8W6R2_9ANNE|nr:DgyrCDS10902 [Dimorphilus gyrociliatus]
MRLISALLLSFIIGATLAKLQPMVYHVFRETGVKEDYPFTCSYGKAYLYKGVVFSVNGEKIFDDGTMLQNEKWKDLGVSDIIIAKENDLSVPILYISKDITKKFAKSMKFSCTVESNLLDFGFHFVEKESCESNSADSKEGEKISFMHSVELSTMDKDMTDGSWIAVLNNKKLTERDIVVGDSAELQKYKQRVNLTLTRNMNGQDLKMKYMLQSGVESTLSLLTECVKKLNVQYMSRVVSIEPDQTEYRIPQTVRCIVESNPKPNIYWISDETEEKVGEGEQLIFDRSLFKDAIPEKHGEQRKVRRNFTCKVESKGFKGVERKVSFNIVVDNIKEEKTEAGNSQTAAIAAGVVICLIILVIVGAVVVYYCRKKSQTGAKKVPTE